MWIVIIQNVPNSKKISSIPRETFHIHIHLVLFEQMNLKYFRVLNFSVFCCRNT